MTNFLTCMRMSRILVFAVNSGHSYLVTLVRLKIEFGFCLRIVIFVHFVFRLWKLVSIADVVSFAISCTSLLTIIVVVTLDL